MVYSDTPGRIPTVVSVFAVLTRPLPPQKEPDAYVREIVEKEYGARRTPRVRAFEIAFVEGFTRSPSINDVKALYEELLRKGEVRNYGSPQDGRVGLTDDFYEVAALFFWHETRRRWVPFGKR